MLETNLLDCYTTVTLEKVKLYGHTSLGVPLKTSLGSSGASTCIVGVSKSIDNRNISFGEMYGVLQP